jgi:hypothetical protein
MGRENSGVYQRVIIRKEEKEAFIGGKNKGTEARGQKLGF